MKKYIDDEVLYIFNREQFNSEEMVIFAKHIEYYDDILGDYDNYYKVLTITETGTIYCYFKDCKNDSVWYKRFY